jgi:hypothetical protein
VVEVQCDLLGHGRNAALITVPRVTASSAAAQSSSGNGDADGPQDGIVHAAGTQYRAPAIAVPVAAWRDLMLDRVPMGRLGAPADLAGAVVFLLSPASGYITG